ncbi:hypothetical protein J0B03_10565 [Alkalibacter rhizosphaerae]|uniref:Uncharacterized protein n=1 Tax=Alkalibacter rhizosphaerae TaxID=2815577 RepID=A0A975AH44_9FIRM|nr:hypothetical protein [Alkalibacter rhizosphaerae]QSX08224.1 hypothetical protein J0B03_10565 [Alkalibacter rhizosphaerae]
MEIAVIKGSVNYIDDYENALVNSELGKRDFSEEGKARKALEEGICRFVLWMYAQFS